MLTRRTILLSVPPMLVVARGLQAAELIPSPYDTPKYIAPENAPSQIVIANKSEAGERLVVTGHVTDGQRPLAHVSLYAFHTDTNGRYTKEGRNDDSNARLYGTMRTDAEGRFRYETIRPVGYGDNGAHVHYVATQVGYKLRMEELRLADDPKALASPPEVRDLKPGESRAASSFPGYVFAIEKPMRDAQGVWHVVHNVVLERI